jgi:hypothetical protein
VRGWIRGEAHRRVAVEGHRTLLIWEWTSA